MCVFLSFFVLFLLLPTCRWRSAYNDAVCTLTYDRFATVATFQVERVYSGTYGGFFFSVVWQKTGKWNAMHVRIAWEIYHHQQQKQPSADIKPSKNELLNRTPSHLFQSAARSDLSPYATPHRPHSGAAFETHAPHAASSPYAALGRLFTTFNRRARHGSRRIPF